MALINDQNACPDLSVLDSRRNDTVTMLVLEAFIASNMICGDGYNAVPSNNLELIVVPYKLKLMALAPRHRRNYVYRIITRQQVLVAL